MDSLALESERLRLRLVRLEDVGAIELLLQDPEIADGVLNIEYPLRENSIRDWIQRQLQQTDERERYSYGIFHRSDEVLIGNINIVVDHRHSRGGLGYWVGKAFWGQGYASEASELVIKFGFEVLGLHRIFAECFPFNIASARVMEKNGMKYEGTLRETVYHMVAGEYRSLKVYGILRSEYEARDDAR